MKRESGHNVSRRSFLRGATRCAAVAGLAMLCRAVLAPGGDGQRRSSSCPYDFGCRGCPTLDGCGRPQAQSFRRGHARRRHFVPDDPIIEQAGPVSKG